MANDPINGLTGKVTSWTGYSALLATLMAEATFTLNMGGNALDSTAFGSSAIVAQSTIPGLRSYTAELNGHFHNAPQSGHTGLVTFASGYVRHCRAWDIELRYDVHEVTEFADTGPTDMAYIAGLARWGGSYTCLLDSDDAVSDILSPASSSASAVFKALENTLDDTLTGNIVTTGAPVNVPVAGLPGITYNFTGDGDLVAAGTVLGVASTGIWSSGSLVTPVAGALTLQAFTSRTFVANAFISRLRLSCDINGLTSLSATAQITGGLTSLN